MATRPSEQPPGTIGPSRVSPRTFRGPTNQCASVGLGQQVLPQTRNSARGSQSYDWKLKRRVVSACSGPRGSIGVTGDGISAGRRRSVRHPLLTPAVRSAKEDHPPGGTVVLTGQNWQPGRAVNNCFNDGEGQSWATNVNVTADGRAWSEHTLMSNGGAAKLPQHCDVFSWPPRPRGAESC